MDFQTSPKQTLRLCGSCPCPSDTEGVEETCRYPCGIIALPKDPAAASTSQVLVRRSQSVSEFRQDGTQVLIEPWRRTRILPCL